MYIYIYIPHIYIHIYICIYMSIFKEGSLRGETARIQETRVKRAPRQPLVLDIPENYPGALSDIYLLPILIIIIIIIIIILIIIIIIIIIMIIITAPTPGLGVLDLPLDYPRALSDLC